MGRELDLENPVDYTEKLQWLKLYDHRPEYTTMVDKYEVKDYVAQRIGKQYVIPLLGVWENVNDIDFSALPEQFVLKTTHDSGALVICKNKKDLDIEAAKKKLNYFLKRRYYDCNREWPYKNVKPRIIAEKYMEDLKTDELRDYKFFCFDGKVRMVFIATDRQIECEETKFDFYDKDFNHLPFTNGHPNSERCLEKPSTFDEMVNIAEILSQKYTACESRSL